MVLLGKGAQVEAQFDLFGDRANLDPRQDARFAQNIPYAQESIWMQPMVVRGKGAQVEAQFDLFGDRANLDPRQDARFAQNIPYAQESIWMQPRELLDDVCHMKSGFGLFGDSVSFGRRQLHGLCLMHHRLRNHFGRARWYSQVKGLKWKHDLVSSEILLILMQDRCTVCVEHTICSEINLDAPDGTPR